MPELKINRNPIQDEFRKEGWNFKMVAKNDTNRIRVYERTTSKYPNLKYYEIIIPQRHKTNEGIIEIYPQTSKFGFGIGLCINSQSADYQKKIEFYLKYGFNNGRY